MKVLVDTENRKKFIISFAYWLILACIGFCFIKYLLPVLMPFVIGWMVAAGHKPLTAKIAGAVKLSEKWVSVFVLLFFYLALSAIAVLVGFKLVDVISDFILAIPDYYVNTIEPAFWRIFNSLTDLMANLDPSARATVESFSGNVISSLTNLVTSFSSSTLNKLTGFAGALPLYVVNFLVILISSFYIAMDFPGIKAFIIKQIKPERIEFIILIKNYAIRVIGKFVKAYMILMLAMFVEMLIGMYIIGVSNPVLVAMGISVFDIFPVLGTGGILVPWAIIDMVMGNMTRALQVMILYGIVTLIRNFLEPKIVGKHIGLHPLLTLMLMYVGALLLGFWGFLLLPLSGVVLKELNDSGSVRLYKS